jgi:hypothetical protein
MHSGRKTSAEPRALQAYERAAAPQLVVAREADLQVLALVQALRC